LSQPTAREVDTKPLLLFDIDGTLIRSETPAVLDAFAHAFRTVFAIDELVHRIDTSGMIDRQILAEIARLHGREPAPAEILRACRVIGDYCRDISFATTVLPGVPSLLALLGEQGYPLGVLTGNVQDVAWRKLSVPGLRERFRFGAFGDEADRRADLVPIALARAREALGLDFPADRTWIVGDTPRDIACARANGARVVAVATGHSSAEQLAGHEPDLLLSDLTDVTAFLAAIDGVSPT
jgi:phosphoglycolate phosphatase-like HAD superfamily hydrolase